MNKFRVAIMTDKKVMSKNCDTREEVDQFILENDAKRFRILDRDLNRVIESDKGIIIKEEK